VTSGRWARVAGAVIVVLALLALAAHSSLDVRYFMGDLLRYKMSTVKSLCVARG
jgi:hypothetical protein